MSDSYKKKLIEVALPLEAINDACVREKYNPFLKNHPRSLHLWWARRPLAACRAVLFAQMVDDPSSNPEKFPTEEAENAERERLFNLIRELVRWENINNEELLEQAREEIRKSAEPDGPPPVLDPFCGGGSTPLEAQRLGLEAQASDLNPVAVLITKAMIELPLRFANRPPVNPDYQGQSKEAKLLQDGNWRGAKGLAEDVRYYGQWMRDEAEKRIGHLYPKVKLPKEHGGGEATVIAWLWARTVKCPNPACGAQMPLVSSFWLSKKKGKQAWIEPQIDHAQRPPRISFTVKSGVGTPPSPSKVGRGAKFRCLACDQVAGEENIRTEFIAKRVGKQLIAIVAKGNTGRVYAPPTAQHSHIAMTAKPESMPEEEMNTETSNLVSGRGYGITHWHEIFTSRQLAALTTFSDLVGEAREQVLQDTIRVGLADDDVLLDQGGSGAPAYADVIATYLALSLSQLTRYFTTICTWNVTNENIVQAFAGQYIKMTWDFTEANPLDGNMTFLTCVNWVASSFEAQRGAHAQGHAIQLDASKSLPLTDRAPIILTDPPYYDNIGYADLSDFFYVWLRRSLSQVHPQLFSTLLTPKSQELIAAPHRFDGDGEEARSFFEEGLKQAFLQMRGHQHAQYPLTLFYAFKQTETIEDGGAASTGWETMLEGLIGSGFVITGTWPMRTERPTGVKVNTNVLASSIVLVCRPRPEDAPLTTRRDFQSALRQALPDALKELQYSNIAPVDLAQASIGPGMAIFSRYNRVVEANGSPMRVRTALALINQALDEYLAEQEGEYDSDTRWALAWFEQHQFNEGPFGDAEVLARARDTSVQGMVEAGFLYARGGQVRLLGRDELDQDWDPTTDKRLTVWEVTEHLIRRLQDHGESGAGELLAQVGGLGETVRDLAYRLYTICDRKGWAEEAIAYNSLVASWSEIMRMAEQRQQTVVQRDLM